MNVFNVISLRKQHFAVLQTGNISVKRYSDSRSFYSLVRVPPRNNKTNGKNKHNTTSASVTLQKAIRWPAYSSPLWIEELIAAISGERILSIGFHFTEGIL